MLAFFAHTWELSLKLLRFQFYLICKLKYEVFPVFRPPFWIFDFHFHPAVFVVLYLSSTFSKTRVLPKRRVGETPVTLRRVSELSITQRQQ